MEASIVKLVNEATTKKSRKSNVFTNKDSDVLEKFPGLKVPRGHELAQLEGFARIQATTVW